MIKDISSILTYAFLYLTVISLWIPKVKKIALWIPAFIFSTVFGLISQRIHWIGFVFIVIFACATLCLNNKKLNQPIRVFSAFVMFALGLGLGLGGAHLLPGFQNARVLDKVLISSNGIPFSLYLNFDKATVGVLILGILHQRISTKSEWKKMIAQLFPCALFVIFFVAVLSLLLHFIVFDPKLPVSLPLWAMTNLLFVCLAEESFFRGFIQKYLCVIWQCVRYGNWIAIFVSAIFFGLSHFRGGSQYILLATVAGIGYGLLYLKTQRIEASILTHFTLNLMHFMFFTYPALASSV